MKSRLGPSKLILQGAHEAQDSMLCESWPLAEYLWWCQGHQRLSLDPKLIEWHGSEPRGPCSSYNGRHATPQFNHI